MPRWGLMAMIAVVGAMPIGPAMTVRAEGHERAAASIPFGQPRPGSWDDGWRRTADGWEHIAEWHDLAAPIFVGSTEPVQAQATIPSATRLALIPGRRLDFHPAALAFLQVTVLAWLAVFARAPFRGDRCAPIAGR